MTNQSPAGDLKVINLTAPIVIAHLRYLKIRLFGFAAKRPLSLRTDLLEQLAALYRT